MSSEACGATTMALGSTHTTCRRVSKTVTVSPSRRVTVCAVPGPAPSIVNATSYAKGSVEEGASV